MKKCQVIIPVDVHPYPEAHELSAALILAHFFETNVEFIRRTMTIKSADVKIKNVEWELKSPIGNGKRTFQNNLRKTGGGCNKIAF